MSVTSASALSSQKNYKVSGQKLEKAQSQISSGKSIIKTSDDAAGKAIATLLGTTISANIQAIKNTTQGSALIDVIAGAIDSQVEMLDRAKTLASQVINGTISDDAKVYADQEFQQIMQQITTTAKQARFGSSEGLLDNDAAGQKTMSNTGIIGSLGQLTSAQSLMLNGSIDSIINIQTATGTISGKIAEVVVVGDSTQANFAAANCINLITDSGEVYSSSTSTVAMGAAANNGAALTFTSFNGSGTFSVQLGSTIAASSPTIGLVADALRSLFKVGATDAPTLDFGRSRSISGTLVTDSTQFRAINKSATAISQAGPIDFATANTAGFINGVVESVEVRQDINTAANSVVTLKIGNRTFRNNVTLSSFGGANSRLTLTDIEDTTSFITLNYNGTAYTNNDRNLVESDLKKLFGVDIPSRKPVEFRTVSNAFNAAAKVKHGLTMSANSALPLGDYTVEYRNATNKFIVKGGSGVVLTKTVALEDLSVGTTIQFDNGLSIKLGDTFSATVDVNPVVFSNQPSERRMKFQIADSASDVLELAVGSTTATALGLSGAKISDTTSATAASAQIDAAINKLNGISATLGAQQRRFELSQKNLETNTLNLKLAKATFDEADITQAVADMNTADLLSQFSQSMMGKANERNMGLMQLLR